MEQIVTFEELLEMHGEELKEYLLTLPLAERRRVSRELLDAREAKGEPLEEGNGDAI